MPKPADLIAMPVRARTDPCSETATAAAGAAPPMSVSSPISSPVSWAATRSALRADRAHWARRIPGPVRLRRGYQAVWLYRMSRYAHERGWRMAAWFIWIVNGWLTGADIPPSSRIAGGLFLPHPFGTIIAGAVGRDAAFGFQASIGGLFKPPERDVGGGPGLPRLGDDVELEPAAIILGAVLVGARARIGPRCLVMKDIDADTDLEPTAWRALPGRSAAP